MRTELYSDGTDGVIGFPRGWKVSLEVMVKERHISIHWDHSIISLAGIYLVLHHRGRVLVDVAVNSEPVETGVLRVAVVVQHTQLHQAPSLQAGHRQPERLIEK